MKKIALMIIAIALSLGAAPGVTGVPAASAEPPTGEAAEPGIVTVDPWTLVQSDGADLFQQLCASCHGEQGVGGVTVLTPEAIHPPPLTHLKQLGVPKAHWVYVIESPCDDKHHRGPHGEVTMPCWQRIFRLALGNDAAPLMVSTKLASYIDTIQAGGR